MVNKTANTALMCSLVLLPATPLILSILQFRTGNVGWAFGWLVVAALFVTLSTLAFRGFRSLVEDRHSLTQTKDALQGEVANKQSAIDALADGLPVALFLCDRRGLIRYANPGAVRMFGFENPQNRTLLAVTLSTELEELALKAVSDGSSRVQEIHFSYPEERVGTASAWVHAANPELVFLSILETTDIRRLRRIRQDFVANVSHELRTPLASIRAMSETLLEEETPSAELQTRYLNKIIHEVDRLSQISNDLLVLSSAESNPVRKNSCDLAQLAAQIVAEANGRASAKGLNIHYNGPSDLLIEANTTQISQVLLNLVDNAIKYTNEGSVVVRLATEGEFARIDVADTGIGIPSEHLERIFERFYRIDKARSRASGGTGLGLSIVRHIVEAHGGTVKVESQLNAGSTFSVLLPIGSLGSEPI